MGGQQTGRLQSMGGNGLADRESAVKGRMRGQQTGRLQSREGWRGQQTGRLPSRGGWWGQQTGRLPSRGGWWPADRKTAVQGRVKASRHDRVQSWKRLGVTRHGRLGNCSQREDLSRLVTLKESSQSEYSCRHVTLKESNQSKDSFRADMLH